MFFISCSFATSQCEFRVVRFVGSGNWGIVCVRVICICSCRCICSRSRSRKQSGVKRMQAMLYLFVCLFVLYCLHRTPIRPHDVDLPYTAVLTNCTVHQAHPNFHGQISFVVRFLFCFTYLHVSQSCPFLSCPDLS